MQITRKILASSLIISDFEKKVRSERSLHGSHETKLRKNLNINNLRHLSNISVSNK